MQISTCSNQTFWVQIGINDIVTHGPKVFTPKSWPTSTPECWQLLISTPFESTTKIPGPQVFSPAIQSCGVFFSNHHGCSRFVWHKIHKEKSWITALRQTVKSFNISHASCATLWLITWFLTLHHHHNHHHELGSKTWAQHVGLVVL